MNHRVHVFISGCLTLKLSGSWKTVISSPSLKALRMADPSDSDFSVESPSGEMGMVSSGTGEDGLGAAAAGVARVAMLVVKVCTRGECHVWEPAVSDIERLA